MIFFLWALAILKPLDCYSSSSPHTQKLEDPLVNVTSVFVDNNITVGRSDLYTPRFLLVLILVSDDECPLLEITILWQQSYQLRLSYSRKVPVEDADIYNSRLYYLLYIFNVLILITKKITNVIFSDGELACFQLHSASKSRVRMVMEKIVRL